MSNDVKLGALLLLVVALLFLAVRAPRQARKAVARMNAPVLSVAVERGAPLFLLLDLARDPAPMNRGG